VVLILLFLVIGPFALPLLWLSPAFRLSTKVVLSVVAIVVTVVGVYLTVMWVNYMFHRVDELFKVMYS